MRTATGAVRTYVAFAGRRCGAIERACHRRAPERKEDQHDRHRDRSAARTPVGAFLGGLSSVPADQLGATVIQEALARAKVDAAEVSDVVLGQVLTAGQGQNPARQAAIKAGLPKETPAITINQVCGSGLRAVAMGYQAIKAGDAGDRPRRRAGEHEPVDPLRLSAQRARRWARSSSSTP